MIASLAALADKLDPRLAEEPDQVKATNKSIGQEARRSLVVGSGSPDGSDARYNGPRRGRGGLRKVTDFTAPDGSKVAIDGKLVVRIRPTVSGENAGARTRIDWAIMSLVKEPVEQVVPLVETELPSLAGLTALEGKKFWFNAKQAVGPLPITTSQNQSGFRSSIKIMGYRQYVIETPDEVRAVIGAAGGTPL